MMSAVLPGRQMLSWLTKQPKAARAGLLACRHPVPTSQLRQLATSGAAKPIPTSAPGQLGSGGKPAWFDALARFDVSGAGSRIALVSTADVA